MTILACDELRAMPNVVPSAYRGVAVTSVASPASHESIIRHFTGREIYRRTRFIVVREEAVGVWILAVERADPGPLFSIATSVQVLADPSECAYVIAPEIDTAVPSNLARTAIDKAPNTKAVVVEGRYAHVNFILNPRPLRVRVTEVTPPFPAKLFDQVSRLLDVAEDLVPMIPHLDVVTFDELAEQAPSDNYLLPCRGSAVQIDGAEMSYLDERPERSDWTLLGCDRSLEIHEWFYGDTPPNVSMCPRKRPDDLTGPSLVKCCLIEASIDVEGGRVVVPWGASLEQVKEGLRELARFWEPTWAPV